MVDLSVTLPMALRAESLADGVERAAALGVDGFEFFDWEDHDAETIRGLCDEHGIAVAGTLSAGGGSNIDDFEGDAMTRPDATERVAADVERSLDAAAALDAPNLIVTTGPEQDDLDRDVQRESVVEVLETVAPAAESAGVTVVVEPLNVAVDHPGYFLTDSAEAFEIVESVGSDRVKVLYDVYHQQITEGNVIETVREHVDLIGHFHIADVPGRHEPGTGEVNYANVLSAIGESAYDGYVGCEFFPAGDPDDAVRSVVDLAP
ncbi:hydroxypyruvate isomerase family protein [Halegenticoccus tardaugens]|uniref:hydroxypyruvate isomerase family protein n=1 Tax=Halegenticoccus tardaugens TaxID=2071624 RepID=UPI00100AF80A|nr:TIM barrel protein [Halegenticoccus tardaugens]